MRRLNRPFYTSTHASLHKTLDTFMKVAPYRIPSPEQILYEHQLEAENREMTERFNISKAILEAKRLRNEYEE